MPTIEITDDLYHDLLKRVSKFGETAEEVIRRLINEVEDGPQREKSLRATPGSILPEREYWRPILSILAEAGGSAPANDAINALWKYLKDSLTPLDLEQLDMGEVRWRNRARFARLRMAQQGLIDGKAPRGIWTITEAGREYLATGGKD